MENAIKTFPYKIGYSLLSIFNFNKAFITSLKSVIPGLLKMKEDPGDAEGRFHVRKLSRRSHS
jgi:hypothetical protein